MDEPRESPERIPHPVPELPLDLTRSILSRTSGSSCQRLQELACDFVDGLLDEPRTTLVRSHLDHCAACASLVKALELSADVLPALAQADLGPWFAQRVLQATTRAPRESARRPYDLRAAFIRLMHRPRIAVEAAYLGAAASLMGLYLPTSMPFHAKAVVSSAYTTVSPSRWTQPLKTPAQRVMGQVIQAERRTAESLQQAFSPNSDAHAKGLWQRGMAKLRKWLRLSPNTSENPPNSANS
jgi:anti-sigma factor RsiW